MRQFVILLTLVFIVYLVESSTVGPLPNPYCDNNNNNNNNFGVSSSGDSSNSEPHDDTGYTVKHVSVIMRHGDRSPINNCWKGAETWSRQCSGKTTTTATTTTTTTSDIDVSRSYGGTFVSGKEDNYRLFNVKFSRNSVGVCERGQLTDRGYSQHVQNGANLRERYIAKQQQEQGFLSSNFEEEIQKDHFYFRTTNFQRTRLSLQALLEGLYPIGDGDSENGNDAQSTSEPEGGGSAIDFYTREVLLENMYVNSELCPVLRFMDSSFRNGKEVKQFFELVNDPLMEQVNSIFGEWIQHNAIVPFTEGLDVVFDCLQAYSCHDFAFPDGMTMELLEKINFNMVWLYESLYGSTLSSSKSTYAQISISSFLSNLRTLLNAVHTNTTTLKLALYSGHDTTLLPLLMSLGVWDKRWPPYASLLQIELLTTASGSGEDFVRVLYNGREMRLPGCGYVSPCPYLRFWEVTERIVEAGELCGLQGE